ncbi:MAG: TrkH family potassium uptake protein [Lachnospiraceae bacterium]|nr:TrkH family potassium uptake protein [Lachnospiraceae bacterium]
MNKKTVINNLGKILFVEAVFMLIPALVALFYGEYKDALYFSGTILGTILISLLFTRVKGSSLNPRDGYVIVTSAWITISLIGAIPLYLTGCFPSYISALFEIISGFTTTGASVMPEPGVLGHGMQFFRCFSHWIGGMGVLVFVLMLLPMENDSSMHLIRAEVPGPTAGKLVPRMKNTSRILYGIYTVMTLTLVVILKILGMPWYDAFCYSFGTAGTGGFGICADGLAIYNSHAIEIAIGIGMLCFGVNFNIYYMILLGKVKDALKNEELRVYFGIILFAVVTVCANTMRVIGSFSDALRLSFFQVSSIMTTTGFSTADFASWPQYSQHLLALLMIIGACAGSTAGGFKVSRVIILWKSFISEIKRAINPKQMMPIRVNGSVVENKALQSAKVYCAVYFIIICLSVLLLSVNGYSFTTNVTAVLACFNNIGPGLDMVGPTLNYSIYSMPAQLLLSLLMLTGRLEIFPIFCLFAKSAHDRL